MLLSQADSALAGQHIQGLDNSAAGGGGIGNGVSGTVGNSGVSAANVLGVSGGLGLGGVDDVIGSKNFVLVQNGDGGLRGQRSHSAALHGDAPVSAGSKDGVSRADSLTGQNGDLDGGSLGIDTGHTGGLADTTGLVIPLARMPPAMSSVALGTKPSVSTMVITGTLKASHRRTKRAALAVHLWHRAFFSVATMPTALPLMVASAVTTFLP